MTVTEFISGLESLSIAGVTMLSDMPDRAIAEADLPIALVDLPIASQDEEGAAYGQGSVCEDSTFWQRAHLIVCFAPVTTGYSAIQQAQYATLADAGVSALRTAITAGTLGAIVSFRLQPGNTEIGGHEYRSIVFRVTTQA